MPRGYWISTLLLASVSTGCYKAPAPDDGMVSSLVAGKIGAHAEWAQGGCPSAEVGSSVQCLLSQPLTPDSAIQIALLNNPGIQALFEEVGVSQADLIEAGLFTNPVFSVEVRYPHLNGLKTNIEYTITACLLDLFLIPIRVKVAEIAYEQTKLRVSNAILDVAFDVRQCLYELIAERQKIRKLQSLVKIAAINRDLVDAQHAVGNIYVLQLLQSETAAVETAIVLSRSEAEAARLTERLHRLLGLPEETCLLFKEIDCSAIECRRFDLCDLERVAFEERLDLHAARLEIGALCNRLGLNEWWAYTSLQIGVAGERDTDGTNVIGPGFAGEIPIFNYGQAARRRLYAELRQALDRLQELQIRVFSEVRESYAVLERNHAIVLDYREKLIPLTVKLVGESESLYNVMGLGVDKLMDTKKGEIETEVGYIESMKRYLAAEVELDRALGGNLSLLMAQRSEREACCE